MLTRCTHCATRLPVAAVDLQRARGWVRCGHCRARFDALVHLQDSPAAGDTVAEDALPELTAAAGAGAGQDRPEEEPELAPRGALPAEAPEPGVAGDGERQAAAVAARSDAGASEASVAGAATPARGAPRFAFGEAGEPGPAAGGDSPPGDEPPGAAAAPSPETPAILAPAPASPAGRGWTLVAVLLLVALLVQIARNHRDAALAVMPAAEPALTVLCELVPCRSGAAGPASAARAPAPAGLKMTARDVREHPRYEDALLVNASLVNTAGKAQAFPPLTLRLFDEAGGAIGERRFLPAEYLDGSIDRPAGMKPDVPVHVTLEVAGAIEGAVGFEFLFR